MDKDELLRMAGDSRYISGIYNYCDRWCERCRFTARCLNFESLRTFRSNTPPESQDAKDRLEEVQKSLDLSEDLLLEAVREGGIDPDFLVEEEPEMESWENTAKEHPLCIDTRWYATLIDTWFEEHEEAFVAKGIHHNDIRVTGENALPPEAAELLDAVDIIRWFQFLIGAKTYRAVSGRVEDEEWEEDEEMKEFPKDSDGSAKVALIGMDRSIEAWERVTRFFPDATASVGTVMDVLRGLRDRMESEFPDARRFVRPGFDQEA